MNACRQHSNSNMYKKQPRDKMSRIPIVDEMYEYSIDQQRRYTYITHQVPTGLLRPRIIGNFQRFFKYSKYGPISKIFFLKVPKSTKFSPPAKKAGRMHRQGASADRKRHSGEKNRHRMSRENYYVSW